MRRNFSTVPDSIARHAALAGQFEKYSHIKELLTDVRV